MFNIKSSDIITLEIQTTFENKNKRTFCIIASHSEGSAVTQHT